MLWLKKKKRPVVGINFKPPLFRSPSPNFAEMFFWEAKRQGRKVVYWKRTKPDILLIISKTSHQDLLDYYKKQGVKVVLRLDGVGVKDPSEPKKDNLNYLTATKSDFIIYQSHFCQRMWERLFSLKKPSQIIYNGADEQIFSREGKRENFGFKKLIVTAARWREWKNLKQVIDVFLNLDESDLGLAVIGDGADVPKHPKIIATGRLSHKKMAEVFRGADLMIYLPWFEWCPKVVVQALVCGLPVVCSNNGGTKELVGNCGIVVPGERDDEEPYLYPNPIKINYAIEAVKKLLNQPKPCPPRPDLYLSTMVEKYFEVFERVLES